MAFIYAAFMAVFMGVTAPSFAGWWPWGQSDQEKKEEISGNSREQRLANLSAQVGRLNLKNLKERKFSGEIHFTGGGMKDDRSPSATSEDGYEIQSDLSFSIPDIDTFAVPVLPDTGDHTITVEIFSSTEKSTDKGRDNWLNQMARLYNELPNKAGKIAIRRIDSGTAYQFLVQQQLKPDEAYSVEAFSPSNSLWVRMAEARGVPLTKISDSLVQNVAGIVISKEKLRLINNNVDTAQFSVANLVDAVNSGKIKMGYTNPYSSSTGLNFLATVLETLAAQSQTDFSSPLVTDAFRKFQDGVPLIYESTLQMREAVKGGESLDAMVMEYQTFINSADLRDKFLFLPFGEPHENPLYASSDLDQKKMEILKDFAHFAEQSADAKQMAREMGFFGRPDYVSGSHVSGKNLIAMQKIWKREKTSGRPVNAVFLGDISGSMNQYNRIEMVIESLIIGAEFIRPENRVGLILFDDRVTRALPIEAFLNKQKMSFIGLARVLKTEGGTAMFDGIAVALHDLLEQEEKHKQDKTVLIVLTDGASRDDRLDQAQIKKIAAELRIPMYILGMEADEGLMEELIMTARSTGGDAFRVTPKDVKSRIASLLNSQL
ncbi:MAG: VWA domain-containing protein [Bdellovibrionales bacterium]|nr:VWA domain-containing protein [Bdellovibrionales bacterium]